MVEKFMIFKRFKSVSNYFKNKMSNLTTINEVQNDMYFGKEVLNRVSFLRERHDFVDAAISHPSSRFIFFKDTEPLVVKTWSKKLVILSNGNDILNGSENISKGIQNLESWNKAIKQWSDDNKNHNHALRDNEQPTILFLGLQDGSVGLDISTESNYLNFQDGKYSGIPFFAVDLSRSPKLTNDIVEFIRENDNTIEESSIFFSTSRKHHLGFTGFEASLFSHGKMFIDWLDRNRFCPGCGSKVIPIHAGGKLHCTNDNIVGKKDNGKDKYDCPVKNASVSNVSFPRTDAVIITAITDPERTKILLSLNKRHKIAKMYSCTSGFMEPSETVEVATKREIWEETGVACSKIDIVMTQPWPFPGNLMIGCIAEVDFNNENEIIDLGHDNELEDARWFDIEFVRKLVYPDNDNNNSESNPEGILIPMKESIAFSLIKLVVDQAKRPKL